MTVKLDKIKKYLDILNKHVDDETDVSLSNMVSPHTVHTTSPEASGDDSGEPIKLKPHDEYLQYSQNQLILLHSFCHLFKNNGAVGMNTVDIKDAHEKIILKLNNHFYFDNLDEEDIKNE